MYKEHERHVPAGSAAQALPHLSVHALREQTAAILEYGFHTTWLYHFWEKAHAFELSSQLVSPLPPNLSQLVHPFVSLCSRYGLGLLCQLTVQLRRVKPVLTKGILLWGSLIVIFFYGN